RRYQRRERIRPPPEKRCAGSSLRGSLRADRRQHRQRAHLVTQAAAQSSSSEVHSREQDRSKNGVTTGSEERRRCANYFFFFPAGFAGFALAVLAACGFVSTPPSSSERPSSTSTVCVTASPPFAAG